MFKRMLYALLLAAALTFHTVGCTGTETGGESETGSDLSSAGEESSEALESEESAVSGENSEEPALSSEEGSSRKTSSTRQGSSSSRSTAGTTHPGLEKYKNTITLTTVRTTNDDIERNLAKTRDKETIEYNRYNRLYEEKLNIKLKYEWIATSGEAYDQKINLAIVSGKLPDFFLVNTQQVEGLQKAGKIQDLTKVYNTYATDRTKKIMSSDATQNDTFLSVTYNGKLYAVPRMWSSYDSVKFLWVRQDWLRKYSLPEPTTIQNVITIAKRFAKEDTDGNGKADTVGLGLQKNFNANVGGIVGFINGYHGYLDVFMKKDGKVVFSDLQPEVKTALLALQDLYKAGAVSKEFATTDLNGMIEKITAGKMGLFYGEHWMPLNIVYNSWVYDEKADWKAYPLPSVDGKAAECQIYPGTTQWFVVNKNCKYPEAIIKLINVAYSENKPEYVTRKDVVDSWSFNPIFVQDPQINIKQMHSLRDYIAGKKIDEEAYNESHIEAYKLYKSGKLQYWWTEEIYAKKGCPIEILKDYYIKKNLLVRSSFKGNPTPAMVKYGSTLDKLVDETFTEIITGSKSGADFDAFVKKWLQLGGQEILDEVAKSGKLS